MIVLSVDTTSVSLLFSQPGTSLSANRYKVMLDASECAANAAANANGTVFDKLPAYIGNLFKNCTYQVQVVAVNTEVMLSSHPATMQFTTLGGMTLKFLHYFLLFSCAISRFI